MSKLRILVTGGAGFVGSVLVPQLLKEGHQVTVLDNLSWGLHGLLPNVGKPGFNLVEGDIRDSKLVSTLVGKHDVVVHLAALVGAQLCEHNRKEATDVNVTASRSICDCLSERQLLVFASTGSVYGQAGGYPCTEETTVDPQSFYAQTKIEGEQIFFRRHNVVVLRFATAFGVSYRMRLDLLVNQFVYEAIKNGMLDVYGRNYVRSIIHVSDIARSILFIIRHGEQMSGQVFNVSSWESNTKEQIAKHVQKVVGCSLRLADSDSDLRNYHLSTERINALGYNASVSLQEGITELVSALHNSHMTGACFNCRAVV